MSSTPTSILASSTSTTSTLTPTPTIYGPFHTASEASGAQAVNRSSVAALTFLVWDLLITLDDEVNLIWPRPWTYTKYVYFIVRYIPVLVEASLLVVGTELTPLFHFTEHDCFIWQVYQAVAITLIIIAVDTILILRVYALFRSSRRIYNLVKCGFAVEIAGMITGIALAIPKIEYNDVCLVTHAPKSMGIWLVSLFFQMFLFSLTVYRFYGTVRSGWGDVPLLSLLMRDGTWAFCLLFLIYLGYAILVAIPHHSYAGVLFCWLLAAFSFSGYRIILNLNDFGSSQKGVSSNLPSTTTRLTNTEIQFTSQYQPTEEAYELSALANSAPSHSVGQASGLSAISDLQLEP